MSEYIMLLTIALLIWLVRVHFKGNAFVSVTLYKSILKNTIDKLRHYFHFLRMGAVPHALHKRLY